MAGFRWQTPPSEVWPAGAAAYVAAVKRGVHGVMQRWAPEIENWMRLNAPWSDKTGNARQTLHAAVEPPTPAEVINLLELIMAHGVIYGYYLEGINALTLQPMLSPPRFQIIEPALDHFAPKVWADIQGLFR